MNIKFWLVLLTILLSSLSLSAQTERSSLTLPLLTLTDKSLETSLREISTYISNKPQGMKFPISKIKFVQQADSLTYEIVGIDNAWTNLFAYGDDTYGYTIINNRLFIVFGGGADKQNIDLNPFFIRNEMTKMFDRKMKPPSGVRKNPKWKYIIQDGKSIQIETLDLDILENNSVLNKIKSLLNLYLKVTFEFA